MAKARAKAEPTTPLRDRLPITEGGARAAVFGLALLAALGGLIGVGLGMLGLTAEPMGMNFEAERARLVAEISQTIRKDRERFQEVTANPHLRADLSVGAYADAAARLQAAWPDLQAVAVVNPRVEEAVAEGDDTDFARLAVLASAVLEPEVVVVGLAGPRAKPVLGLAVAVVEDGDPLAVAYGELPAEPLLESFRATAVAGGLFELRYNGEGIYSHGDQSLRSVAKPEQVPATPFQVALGVPRSATGATPLGNLGIGFGGLVLAVLLFGAARRLHFSGGGVSHGPTLAQTLAEAASTDPASVEGRPADRPKPAADRPKPAPSLVADRSIFRAYDIRGVVGQTLDAGVARLIGQAIGSQLQEQGLREIVVGRDGRLSGPDMAGALIDGLRSTGCDVIDIGQAATPVVYFASYQLHAGSCVAVTGSHNPPDYNGFKIVVGGETLSGEAIQALYERIAENRLHSAAQGGLQVMDISRDYIDRISSDVQLERRMRVVVDCGNGVAGAIAPEVLEAIGCAAEPLYCEVDGSFPNHHPDPSDPENLRDLCTAVQRTGAELGLALDGDGDRLGVVTRSGKIIYPDRVLMLFAQDVLSRNPGAAVIYDVKCTGHLSGQILRHGGSPIMWKTGHSLIKAKMRETAAELAGEMSGHFFFKERWYGFDDGVYAAARLLEILAADDRDPDEIFAELPDSVSTPELKIAMQEGEHYAFIDLFREKARFDGAKIVTIDGVRADWPDGWGLLRCSNTTPSLVMRFDADSEEALLRIKDTFRSQITALRPGLALPF